MKTLTFLIRKIRVELMFEKSKFSVLPIILLSMGCSLMERQLAVNQEITRSILVYPGYGSKGVLL